MQDTLEFPPIDAPTAAPEPAAPAAPAAPVTQKPAAIADNVKNVGTEIARFDTIEAGLAAIEKAHPVNVIVAEMNTKAGMDAATEAWRAYRNPRLEVEKARKAAKAPLLALGKAIDTYAESLEGRLLAGEKHYKALIDTEEKRRADEKAEKERKEAEAQAEAARIEAARVDALKERLTELAAYPKKAAGATSGKIGMAIVYMQALDFGEDWQEFAQAADAIRLDNIAVLTAMQADAVRAEADAAERERQRLENERIAADLARQRAELEAEAARLDKARRDIEALKAQQDAEAQAQRDANEQAAREHEAEQQRQIEAADRAHEESMSMALVHAEDAVKAAAPAPAPAPEPAPFKVGVDFGTSPDQTVVVIQPTKDLSVPAVELAEPEPDLELNLGALSKRFALADGCPFPLSRAVLDGLGIKPDREQRGAALYLESRIEAIKAALVGHFLNVK